MNAHTAVSPAATGVPSPCRPSSHPAQQVVLKPIRGLLCLPPGAQGTVMDPRVYGYIRPRPADTPEDIDRVLGQLASYANHSRLRLVDVFTERWDLGAGESRGEPVFTVLVEALRSPNIYGVVVPSLAHFSRFPGMRHAMRALIELETGRHVLVMHGQEEQP